jgi:hypothetical protein
MTNYKRKFAIRSFIAKRVQYIRYLYYKFQGFDIHSSTIMERNLNLDRLYPKGIHIGKNSLIA